MVIIVDYDLGNVFNVKNSLKAIGLESKFSSDPKEILKAKAVVLPGVGAFRDAIKNLKERDLIKALQERHKQGKFTLGICLGMQVMFEKSYEDGEYEGLGLLKGEFRRFETDLVIPHMGWNDLLIGKEDPILENLPEKPYVYFVHSYVLGNFNQEDLVAYSEYDGVVPAIVRNKNTIGMQFHPEKSSKIGRQLLLNFKSIIEEVK